MLARWLALRSERRAVVQQEYELPQRLPGHHMAVAKHLQIRLQASGCLPLLLIHLDALLVPGQQLL